jgi:hypothetical protein
MNKDVPIVGSRFTIRAEHPAYAGKIVRTTLRGANNEAVDRAALLTSELVADAMIDADADPQLFIDTREGHIYVEVRATDSLRRRVEPLRTRGWTLTLLDTSVSSWGIESRSDCRAVWFALNF